jgi:hypothetical protein
MSTETGGEGGREGLFSALKNLLATLLAIGKTRAELLVTEIEEEKFRLMSLWAKAIGASFLFALGLIMLVFLHRACLLGAACAGLRPVFSSLHCWRVCSCQLTAPASSSADQVVPLQPR